MNREAGVFPTFRKVITAFLCFCVLSMISVAVHAQTATSASVSGEITDPSGAAVPGARITLAQGSTGTMLTATADSAGHYIFPTVPPGQYTLQASKAGFRTGVVSQIDVQIMKTYTVDVQLELGQVSQTVQVTASPEAALQTINASVGNVLSTSVLENLPQFSRDATSLVFLQPGVTPNSTSGNTTTGGQIAGARSDQISYTIDGGDATSDLEGTNGYANAYSTAAPVAPGAVSSAPVIPNPIGTTQEFRVVTSGATAIFSRSAGGEVTVETKRGTNQFHGEAYEYHDDDALNANRWANDASGVPKGHSVDNRFGANIGGPLAPIFDPGGTALKDRAWFFFGWEEHLFHDSTSLSRLVPTDTLKQGILQFQDASGNVDSYSLAPGNISSNCGPSGTSLCDPRNLGMSPVIASQLALYPKGNFSALGDGLNTTGFLFNVPTPDTENIGVVRLDFTVSPKWSFFTTYHLARANRISTDQVNIVSNPPTAASSDPIEPSMITFDVTGQLSPNFTTIFHGSYTRNDWSWQRTPPAPFVAGATQALQLAGEGIGNDNTTTKLLADPININTQQARARLWDGHDWYLADDMSWVHGNHLLRFGASGYIFHDYHVRTDDVLGGLTSGPINFIEATGNGSGEFLGVGSSYEPPACAGSVLTNCLPTTAALRFDELYASVLGLVDRSAQVETRSGNFQPNPLGTPAFDRVTVPAFYTYLQDTWQLTKHLAATYGLNWGVQLPASEETGKIVILTNPDGSPVNDYAYLAQRENSLEKQGVSVVNGQLNAFNPLFGLTPTDFLAPSTGLRTMQRFTTWHDIGPRASLAWNVPYRNWFFGHNQDTVIRGGYALMFDRTTAVNQVLSNLLVGGLADVDTCGGPLMNGSCSGGSTSPANAFRIGVDGNHVPLPLPTAQPIPYVPSEPFGLFLTAPLDPYATPGWNHNVTLSVQRALPGRMLLEVGYIGRFSRNLAQGLDLTAPDYRTKDAASGQTYAQAFDGVAQALRNGTPIPTEPFFEHMLGGAAQCQADAAGLGLGGVANCSQFVAAADSTDLINGSLGDFDADLFNLYTPTPLDNSQALLFAGVSDGGFSNYNAGYLSLQKQFSGTSPFGGLAFQLNWTWSHAIGNQGLNQENTYSANSPYNLHLDYSSEPFDRRNVITGWWSYPLPFGRGRSFSSSNGFLNRLAGGWRWSGVLTFETGLPMCVFADGDYGAGFQLSQGNCAVPLNGLNLGSVSGSVKSNVPGSNGIGTQTLGTNLFANPSAVYQSLTRPLMSQTTQIPFDAMRGPNEWDMDFEISKNIAATERYKVYLAADFLNAFNHPNFGGSPTSFSTNGGTGPSLDLNSPATFGVFTNQSNTPRQIQLSARLEF